MRVEATIVVDMTQDEINRLAPNGGIDTFDPVTLILTARRSDSLEGVMLRGAEVIRASITE